MSIDEIVNLAEGSGGDERKEGIMGFLLGFPETAIRYWPEYLKMREHMRDKAPSLTSLMKDSTESRDGWEEADLAQLKNIAARYHRLEAGVYSGTISNTDFPSSFFRVFRTQLEALYRKYFSLSDEEMRFIFDAEVVNLGVSQFITAAPDAPDVLSLRTTIQERLSAITNP